jgi:GAF domain-containing protein
VNRFLYLETIDDLTEAASATACSLLSAEQAVVYLLDEVHNRIFDPQSGRVLDVEGPGFAPYSVFNRETVVANDAPRDERRDADMDGIVVAAAVPLLCEGRIVGALQVNRTRPQGYTEADRTQLEQLAQEIATGLVAVQLRDDLNNLQLHTGEWLVAAQEAVAPGGKGHIWRVSQVCTGLAEALTFSAADRQRIWLAAQYHDLGWVLGGEEDALTLKRNHPLIGARALRGVRRLETLADVVELHHERFDGSGSPQGLAGASMSLEACILSLAEDLDECVMARRATFTSPADLMDYLANFLHIQGVSHHPRIVSALEGLAGQGRLRSLYY